MLILKQTSTDPRFNIATEEYLLKNFTDDFFILYQNKPSIIVGKHQNTIAEINLDYVQQKDLPVIRRLSGGGTVYHDSGNLNYTFISNGSEGNLVDFKKFTQPIIDVLNSLGVEARIGGKNDIRVGDKKISGNAEHVYKNRVLHHGTLLFSSNLDELNESIKVNPNTYTDKAVKSIRSHVANISEYLTTPISIDQFAELIETRIKSIYPNSTSFILSTDNINSISKLVKEKYSTWEWNFGYSPAYVLNRTIELEKGQIYIEMTVEKGIINQISIKDDQGNSFQELEQLLIGCNHDFYSIIAQLKEVDLDKFIFKLNKIDLISGLF